MSDAPHTQPPGQPVPASNTYQLTGDDYENIWLRVKDRGTFAFLGFLSLVLAVVGVVGGVGGYEIARRQLEETVARHTQTAEFRDNLTEYTRQQIPALQSELVALEQRAQALRDTIAGHQQQIAAMQQPPIAIDPLGARWTAPDGRSLQLQTGRIEVNSFKPTQITFTTPFADEPIVLVALNEAQPAFARGTLWTANVTTTGMEIHSMTDDAVAQ